MECGMKQVKRGGGWPAIRYALRLARRSGGLLKFYRALSTRNACKTCALGMGGQNGGMVDEQLRFPEVCKKSMQAMAADMQGRIASEFWDRYAIDQLRACTPRELEHMGRLVEPLYAGPGDTHYRPLSWDHALQRCIEILKSTPPDENFFYVSGRSSNEAAFLLQLFARLYGTNNVNNCSYYCHQASGVGLSSSVGTGTATVQLEDLEHCDLFFLIGGNPASNHPRLMRQLMQLRRQGGSVIVINPMVETGLVNFSVPSDVRSLLFGSPIASIYVQPHIGGDIALLTGVAKRILELDATDTRFISGATEGWAEWRARLEATAWSTIESASGVERRMIERVAERYAESRAAVFGWTMGITHHVHGVDNVRAIVNLALMRGMAGRSGAGLLPIRGHSNVQGVGSVGVAPALKQAVFERLQSRFGVKLPTTPGRDTLACMQAIEQGKLRAGWCLGGNLYGANPDAAWTRKTLGQLDSIVYFSTTLNTGHAWGRARHTLVLPMLVRDEEAQATTQESMFNFVRLSDGGPRRLEGPRSEVEVIAALADGVLGSRGPIDWQALRDHGNIRKMIAAVVPGFEQIAHIDQTRQEFHIAGRVLHSPRFATPSVRARFHSVAIPSISGAIASPSGAPARKNGSPEHPWAQELQATLMLMTLRSEGQFNTVVYDEDDLYRGQERRDVILMNQHDIDRLGLSVNDRVTVHGPAGGMRSILVRRADIRPGNAAMYYPEANALVPTQCDPESRTPAFKAIPITLTPELAQAPPPANRLVQLGTPV